MRPYSRLLSGFAAVLIAVAGLLVVSPTPAQANEARVVCNHDWVRVRAAASTTSRELGRLPRGTGVSGVQQGSWFRLADGTFVASYYTCAGVGQAAPAPAASAPGTHQVCRTPWVRVRAGATTASAEIGRLTQGTVFAGRRVGSWIQLDAGGHVAASYACPAPANATVPAPAPVEVAVPPSATTHQVCRTPWVRVRAAATTSSRELRRLTEGTTMSGQLQGSWLRLDGGGFVSSYYACAYAAPAGAPQPAPQAPVSDTPLLQPTGTQGSPTSPFGQRFHPILRVWRLHNGIDIGNRAGEPVFAAEAGVVTTVARDATAGLYVKIDHGTVAGNPRVGTGYLHLDTAVVAPGQRVARGQLIGTVGNTGLSTKPHLHFIVYESNVPVNPEKYIGPLSTLRA